MIDEIQLAELAALAPGAGLMPDGDLTYVYLPGLKIMCGEVELVLDALLCPVQHGGYSTRLFLAEQVQGRGQNWSVHNILSRTWHTWSWNHVPATLTPMQILSAHLKALR
jgi:hypothetical protein